MVRENKNEPKPVEKPTRSKFILKVRRGLYKVVDMDCNPVSPIPCPDHVDEIWNWGPKDAGYECYELEVGKWYHFEESNAWTYTELVTPKGMEGLEVHPHPLKYAVPRCRDKGVE